MFILKGRRFGTFRNNSSIEHSSQAAAPDGPGTAELESCIAEAEADGCVGVPHYVFDDATSGRRLGLFGREHLAVIREKFQAMGLARTPDVRPDFSHAWRG